MGMGGSVGLTFDDQRSNRTLAARLAEFADRVGTGVGSDWSPRIPNSPLCFNVDCRHGCVMLTHRTSACAVAVPGEVHTTDSDLVHLCAHAARPAVGANLR